MTTKPLTAPPRQAPSRRLPPLPDPPRKGDMQESVNFELTADMNTLARHYGADRAGSTTLVAGRGYLCLYRSDLRQRGLAPYPDMLVAFGVDADELYLTNGYVISEVGKPPAMVLEVGSRSTGKNDYIDKRVTYARLGVPEYWRFDPTGGDNHDAPLGGDRLTPEGVYEPIELHAELDGVIWGYSEALGLSICWVPDRPSRARLRFWDPKQGRYLRDPYEEREGRIAAEDQAAAEREGRMAEREGRMAAEDQAAAEREGRMAEREGRMAAEDQAAAEREGRMAAEDQAAEAERRAIAAEQRAEAQAAADAERIRRLERELRGR